MEEDSLERYNFLMKEVKFHRKKKEYKLAEEYAEQACSLAIDENQKRYSSYIYWNSRAKRLESEEDFSEAAECYKQSGDVIANINEKLGFGEYSNYYKCLALSETDPKKAENYFDRAIRLAEKGKDKQGEYYLRALKYEHLSKFESDKEKKLEYLEKAKKYYIEGEHKKSAEVVKFLINEIKRKRKAPYT